MKKIIFAFIAVLSLSFTASMTSGCNVLNTDSKQLIGTWQSVGFYESDPSKIFPNIFERYIFDEDGTVMYYVDGTLYGPWAFKYSSVEGKLTLGKKDPIVYPTVVEGSKMTINYGTYYMVYEKKR